MAAILISNELQSEREIATKSFIVSFESDSKKYIEVYYRILTLFRDIL